MGMGAPTQIPVAKPPTAPENARAATHRHDIDPQALAVSIYIYLYLFISSYIYLYLSIFPKQLLL